MIELKDVTKSFGRLVVLQNLTLRIDPGEFVCVTGPSGAGKSTFLSLLVGAQDVTSGSVLVDGVNLRTVPSGALQVFRRRVGIVFQDYKLLQNRTVEENIAFPLEVCGATEAQIQARVTALLKRMKLANRATALPSELSGGEKARTAIARAIAHSPLIVIADEPTGNLDPEQAKGVMMMLGEIHREGATVILATHDIGLIQSLKTRVIEFSQGKLVADSGATEPRGPAQEKRELFTEPAEEALTAMDVEEEPVLTPAETEADGTAPMIEHDDDGEVAVMEEDAKGKKKGKKAAANGRKVRITSIHSD